MAKSVTDIVINCYTNTDSVENGLKSVFERMVGLCIFSATWIVNKVLFDVFLLTNLV